MADVFVLNMAELESGLWIYKNECGVDTEIMASRSSLL